MISRSPSYQLRNRLGEALEKLATPPRSRIQQPSNGWNFSGDYFCIRADRVGNLRIDLKRIRWLEELKLVQLFIFFSDKRLDRMTIYKGKRMTTNQWIYKAAREVLPAERIAVWERYQGRLGNPESPFGLPELPVKYRELNMRAEPPVYYEVEAKEFMRGP